MKKKHPLAAVCLEAARRVAEGEEEYCCVALRDAAGDASMFRSPLCAEYMRVFGDPEGIRDLMTAQWNLGDHFECEDVPRMSGHRTPGEKRKLRVLALCFFAAMAETGDVL